MAWAEEWADGQLVSRVEIPDNPTPPTPTAEQFAALQATVDALLALIAGE